MNAVVNTDPHRLETVNEIPPTLAMMLRAVESGADLERIEKLMQLHERFESNEARKSFESAMAKFRAEEMTILKSKHVDIPGGAKFCHAQLADVCAAVIPALSKYGLRHKWKYAQEPDKVTVTCIISHEKGHSEETVLFGPPDKSGNKSQIHAVASTVALLERYTLMGAVGLAAREMDSNPQGTGAADPEEIKAPDDYLRWRADTKSLADEGRKRLWDHWEKSPQDIRQYAVSHDMPFWQDCKAIAGRATKKAQDASREAST